MNPYLTDVVGTRVRVIKHTDPTLVGLEGDVVDERKTPGSRDRKGTEVTAKDEGNIDD